MWEMRFSNQRSLRCKDVLVSGPHFTNEGVQDAEKGNDLASAPEEPK